MKELVLEWIEKAEGLLKAIDAGFGGTSSLKSILENEDDGIGSLKGTPEWEQAREMVAKIEAEASSTNG